MKPTELVNEAMKAAKNAYVPYSGFTVGAALETKNGRIYTGCNIENASFSPTCCAERTAFFKAVSEGERQFSAIAVVGGKGLNFEEFCPPCGVCRQVMSEFCGSDFKIILGRNDGSVKEYTLGEILPGAFELK